MPRGLDHIVHAVRDLDAAGALYERLGFKVGARNRHAWGTHNRLVQIPGFYVELLTVAEPEKLGTDGFSVLFGAFNQTFLQKGEGLSMLLLASDDAALDATAFRGAGIAASGAMRFEREGRRADGSAVRVAFSLAFAKSAGAGEAGFAVCEHHFPENLWSPELQDHANSAVGIAGVVLVAENPSEHRTFLSAYTGERAVLDTSTGVVAKTPRGEIEVKDRAAFANDFGVEPPETSGSARLVALRFIVRDVTKAAAALRRGKIAAVEQVDRLVVGPSAAMGATLVFETSRGRAVDPETVPTHGPSRQDSGTHGEG